MNEKLIVEHLLKMDQPQLCAGVETLSACELDRFWRDLTVYTPELLHRQRAAKLHPKTALTQVASISEYETFGNPEDKKRGEKLISEGRVACLLLAGGQGTRLISSLASTSVKGMFPVTAFKRKTLFQLFFERTKAASHQAGRALSVAVMTSPLNHEVSVDYLKSNHYFGVSPEQIDLFSQDMLPFLDENGNWMLSKPGEIASGPSGNGECLKRLYETGIWNKWQDSGVEYVNVVLVDNALADPFDATFVGCQARRRVEILLKSVKRDHPHEKVGVLAQSGKRVKVIEYSEIDDKLRSIEDFPLANISLFSFHMSLIEKVRAARLPWHLVRKKAMALQGEKEIWKFETFLFDLLDMTTSAGVILYPRHRCFAPLKQLEGEASPASVEALLQASDREVFFGVSGIHPKRKRFELDPAFYYPTAEMIRRWKGRELPELDYIEDAEINRGAGQ